jgi:hypothetical protein
MISMKRKPDGENSTAMPVEGSSKEEYPYGLCIRLGKEELKKLGITQPPSVGSKMTITAAVYVKSTSAYEYAGEDKDMSVELQITDMEIGEAQDKGDAATLLYGGD